MADVITRFKLETTAFDSKLRDSAKSLQAYGKQAELAGKDFTNFSQKAVEAARSLGTIASGANNTKDKLKDLVGAYNDVAKTYNKLTEQQQQTDFGKAMSQSLEQLQVRIKETKDELYGLSDAVKGKGGGLFGEGGLTGMLQVAGGNLLSEGISALAGGLKDAWTQSIELAKAGEGVRIAFERLNQPGLLDRLKEATHGTVSEVELMKQAIQFENFKLPLEDLATYLAFAQQKAKDTGQSIDYLVNSIVTGLGRQSKQILDNLGISASELTRRMNEGADMTKAVADIIREEMGKAGDYVETAADRAAKAAADATNEMEAFGRQAAPIAEQWGQTWNALSIGAMDFASTLLGPVADSIRSIQNILGTTLDDRRIAMFEAFDKLSKQQQAEANKKKPTWGDVPVVTAPGGYVEITDKNTGAVIGGKHFDNLNDKNAIKDWQKSLNKTPKTPKTKSGKTETVYTEGSIAAQAKLVSDLTKKWNEAGEDMRNGYLFQLVEAEKKLKSMKGQQQALKDMLMNDPAKDVSPVGLVTNLAPDLKKIEEELAKNPIKLRAEIEIDPDKIKSIKSMAALQKTASDVAQVVGSIGEAFNAIEDPAAKVAGTVAQAIANIALGYSQAMLTPKDPISWIAFGATGLAQMLTMISAIHGATGYAQGGIVKGNSYSGDNIYGGPDAMVNAGELVLTRAQQSNLASQLQGGGMGGWKLTTKLAGTDLLVSLERTLQKQGYGRLATWQ